jgi:hypothetical protein
MFIIRVRNADKTIARKDKEDKSGLNVTPPPHLHYRSPPVPQRLATPQSLKPPVGISSMIFCFRYHAIMLSSLSCSTFLHPFSKCVATAVTQTVWSLEDDVRALAYRTFCEGGCFPSDVEARNPQFLDVPFPRHVPLALALDIKRCVYASKVPGTLAMHFLLSPIVVLGTHGWIWGKTSLIHAREKSA